MTRETNIVAFPVAKTHARKEPPQASVAPPQKAKKPDIELWIYDCLHPLRDSSKQMQAGEFAYVGRASIKRDIESFLKPGRVVLEPIQGVAMSGTMKGPTDLMTMMGYEAYRTPSRSLILEVGHREIATAILEGAGIAWHDEHVVISEAYEMTMNRIIAHGLIGLSAYNAHRIENGKPRVRWIDIFPHIREGVAGATDAR